MIYIVITFFIEIILNSLIPFSYQNISIFFPALIATSIPIFYLIIKNKTHFFCFITILGIIYDILYSEILLINVYYFIFISFFIYIYYETHEKNIFNIFLLSLLSSIFYDTFIFFILIFINYSNFKIEYLYYKIIHTLMLSFIYIITSLIILKCRIFNSKKSKYK